MRIHTLNTLELSKKLTKAGLKKEVSETLAEELKDIQDNSVKNVATKDDVEYLRTATKNDIALVKNDIDQLRTETKKDIALVRQEIKTAMYKVITVVSIANIGVFLAIWKLASGTS